MSRESKLVKNTAILAMGNLCTKGVSFLMLPLYTALLNTSEYGIVDMVSTYSGIAAIALTLQLEQGLFRFLVEARDDAKLQFSYIRMVLLGVSGILTVFVVSGGCVLNALGYEYTLYLLLNTVVSVLNAVMLQIPRGMGNTQVYAVGCFLSASASVMLNVLFVAVFRWGVEGMLTAGILGTVICLFYVGCSMDIRTALLWNKTDWKVLKPVLRFSLPLIPYTLCWWVIGASDRVIIRYTLGITYNGIYAVANKFSSIYNMVSGVFQTAWMESAYETIQEKDNQAYYQRMINYAVRFYAGCNLLIISGVPFVISIMISPAFSAAYQYVPILMTAAMFHAISAMYGALYFAMKKTSNMMHAALLTALINLLINLGFIRIAGLYAAAASTLLAYGFLCVTRYRNIRKQMHVRVSSCYLVITLVMHFVIFYCYYIGNLRMKLSALVIAVCFAVITNRNLICGMYRMIKGRFGYGQK